MGVSQVGVSLRPRHANKLAYASVKCPDSRNFDIFHCIIESGALDFIESGRKAGGTPVLKPSPSNTQTPTCHQFPSQFLTDNHLHCQSCTAKRPRAACKHLIHQGRTFLSMRQQQCTITDMNHS